MSGKVALKTPTIMDIKLDKITDASYQRGFNAAKAKAIAADFKAEECGILVVTDQGDGTFSGTDGQHRLWALRSLGYESWPCQVMSVRPLEDEARVFVDINSKRTALAGADKWRARRMAQDPVVLAVEDTVWSVGCTIEHHNSGHSNWRAIRATNSLERVYAAHGANHLADVLRIAGNAWPEDRQAFSAPIILALSSFLTYYSDDPAFHRGELVDKLARIPVRAIFQEAGLGSGMNASGSQTSNSNIAWSPAVVAIFVNLYNYKRRTHLLEMPTQKRWAALSRARRTETP